MHSDWLDKWKGLLIVLVVLGHFVGGASHLVAAEQRWVFEGWYKMIYAFHMPAFFVVAGLTWSKYSPFCNYVGRKAFRLLVPYVAFGIASALVYVLMNGSLVALFSGTQTGAYNGKGQEPIWMPFVSLLHAGGWPGGAGFQCNSVLWFLPVMFTMQVLSFWVGSWRGGRWTWIGVALLSIPMTVYMNQLSHDLPWGLGLLFKYWPYFIVGHLLGLARAERLVASIFGDKWALLILLLVGYSVICLLLPNRSGSYYSVGWHAAFCCLALLGIVVSGGLSYWLPTGAVCRIGMASLTVMLTHKFLVLLLMNVNHLTVKIGQLSTCVLAVLLLAYTVITVGICYFIHRVVRKFCPCIIGMRVSK